MDKKKVKELIEQAIIWSRQANQYSVISNLEEALKELNKSDWVSVEDGLPDYEEDVLVCNENEPSDMWFGHRTSDRRVVVDENEFAKGYGTITHWHKIDKLEV